MCRANAARRALGDFPAFSTFEGDIEREVELADIVLRAHEPGDEVEHLPRRRRI